ncbi:MAG: hypothetical protein JXQ87_01775 [Bacteroidia bacterium]
MKFRTWLYRKYLFIKNYSVFSQVYFWLYVKAKKNVEPKPIFIIFGMGRVGSTLFIQFLNQSEGIRADGEILDKWVLHLRSFILYRAIRSQEANYCFRVKHFHINRVQSLSDSSFVNKLKGLSIKFIYIERLNLKKVALSAEVAKATKRYNSLSNREIKQIQIPIHLLNRELSYRVKEKAREVEFLKLVSDVYYHIVYENDLINLVKQQITMDSLLTKMGVETMKVTPNLSRLAKGYESQIENYAEIQRDFLRS